MEEEKKEDVRLRALKKILLPLGAFIILSIMIVYNLPDSYSIDLSLIGKGKPAVVLIFDYNLAYSHILVEHMNGVKGDFEDKIEFLVADTRNPEAQPLMRKHNASAFALLFFDNNGKLLQQTSGVNGAEALKGMIETLYF